MFMYFVTFSFVFFIPLQNSFATEEDNLPSEISFISLLPVITPLSEVEEAALTSVKPGETLNEFQKAALASAMKSKLGQSPRTQSDTQNSPKGMARTFKSEDDLRMINALQALVSVYLDAHKDLAQEKFLDFNKWREAYLQLDEKNHILLLGTDIRGLLFPTTVYKLT